MPLDLWGQKHRKSGNYLVFHDESEPTKAWLFIGLLFVRQDRVQEVLDVLRHYRRQENYTGEIHFSTLPRKFAGPYGAKARVARGWLQAYPGLCEHARFTCLAVHRASPKFDHKRFSEDFHAYNRFTAMAIKAGISWLLGPEKYDELHITVISDAKERKSRPTQGIVDNFDEYLAYRVEFDAFLSQQKNPMRPSVKVGDILLEDSAQHDLLQLTDLLLGALQNAVVAGSQRETKRYLAETVARWCEDIQKVPRKQKLGMRRKFHVWGFPDDKGRPFNRVPCRIVEQDQLSLF